MVRGILMALAASAVIGWIVIAGLREEQPVRSLQPSTADAEGARAGRAQSPAPTASDRSVEVLARQEAGPRAGAIEVLVLDGAGQPAANVGVLLFPIGSPDVEDHPLRQESQLTLGYTLTGESQAVATRDLITSGRTFASDITDDSGLARIEDFVVPAESVALELRVRRIRAPDLVRRLELPPPPSLTVKLPPTGQLEVEVFCPTRPELCAEHSVQLWRKGCADWTVETREGIARFDQLAADMQYEVVVRRYGQRCAKRVHVTGPAVQGGTVRVRIPVEPHPRVLARLVDEEGRPLSGGLFADSAPIGDSKALTGHATYLTVTEDGRLDLELRTDDQARELHLRLAPERGAPRVGRVALPPLALGAEHRLGDLPLVAVPLAVAGRVVDAEGQPVLAARVRIFERSTTGRVRALGEELEVGPDGGFALHAQVAQLATLTVQARAIGFTRFSALRISPGEGELLVKLVPSGRGAR